MAYQDMFSGQYTHSDSAGGSTGTVRMPTGGVLDRGAHWRNLTNMIEPSVCGGDAALRQITSTTRKK